MEAITIYGLVAPYEWKFDGEPLKLKICTNGEIDYLVKENQVSQDLFPYIREWVYVSGNISQSEEGQFIEVESISKFKIGGKL